jgi:hypothetical protein
VFLSATYFHPRLMFVGKASGMYYKYITILNFESSIVNKLVPSLTGDAKVVIYDHYMFIVHATGL